MKWWLILQCAVLKLIGLSILIGTEFTLWGWVLFFSGGGVVLAHIFLPRAQGLCDVVTAFEPEGKEVWLTIDDGPDSEDTPAILKVLAAHGAKATFFMIGARATAHLDLVDQALAAGHSIGSHTQTHPMATYWAAGPGRVRRELDDSLAALRREGAAVSLYRSPVGIKNFFLRRALAERELSCVAWTIRSGDALSQSPDAVVKRVERELRPGAILLMHEGERMAAGVRVVAICRVLQMLDAKGYRCVLPEEHRFVPGHSPTAYANFA